MIFEFSGNEYQEYLINEYDEISKININFIDKEISEFHEVKIPTKWLETGYISIDLDGTITMYGCKPFFHEESSSWDIADYNGELIEFGILNRDVSNWLEMIKPLSNPVFVL